MFLKWKKGETKEKEDDGVGLEWQGSLGRWSAKLFCCKYSN